MAGNIRSIKALYKSINDTRDQYIAQIDKEKYGAPLKAIIVHFAVDAINTVEQLLPIQADRFVQTFYRQVLATNDTLNPITDDALKDLSIFPLHIIKTNFIETCGQMMDVIQTAFESAERNMKRTVTVYATDAFDMNEVPADYSPSVFPFMGEGWMKDDADAVRDGDESEFPEHLQTMVYEATEKLVDDVNAQVAKVRDPVAVAIRTCETIPEDISQALLAELDQYVVEMQESLDKAKEAAADALRSGQPESYDDKSTVKYWDLVMDSDANGVKFTRDLNEIAGRIVNNMINMYERISQVYGNNNNNN